ncbi:hypothetical protein A2U01_0002250 [Trifolium medium]|uniref:Uncharacterized protein n=1 Tax=Trifolium medium TaxID=97028 RepID=A0A392M370_9FABA|nr:hypothetical protein [Trifolium medium]
MLRERRVAAIQAREEQKNIVFGVQRMNKTEVEGDSMLRERRIAKIQAPKHEEKKRDRKAGKKEKKKAKKEERRRLRKEMRDAMDEERKQRKADRAAKNRHEQFWSETRAAFGITEAVPLRPEGGEYTTW